jgi:hypothetical protein
MSSVYSSSYQYVPHRDIMTEKQTSFQDVILSTCSGFLLCSCQGSAGPYTLNRTYLCNCTYLGKCPPSRCSRGQWLMTTCLVPVSKLLPSNLPTNSRERVREWKRDQKSELEA